MIFADESGIHFEGTGSEDIVVDWGEIASICTLREESSDSGTFLDVYVVHISDVDFHFHDSEAGYEQVMGAMEKHLIGFSRARAEAARTFEEEQDIPVAWTRDLTVQPFQLRPQPVDPREPTPEEICRMDAAHKASIATCEKVMGRALTAGERSCVYTGFENGRIVGSIAFPLSAALQQRQDERLGRRFDA